MIKQKIIPHLWFDTQAKEACEFYVSVFDNSKINSINQIKDTPSGDCDVVSFSLLGHEFMAISAGPYFTLNPAISFMVGCETREEVDTLWNKLIENGEALMPLDTYPFSERYGWVKDKFGVSWQINPENMSELMAKNPEKTTPAMLKMKRINISELEKAGEE